LHESLGFNLTRAKGGAIFHRWCSKWTNVEAVIELQGSGHWLMKERLKETMDALVEFL
jgi:hypothetical protein